MVNEDKLPSDIYFISGPQRARPYTSRGHVKQALKGRFSYSLDRVRVYQAIGSVDGWLSWWDITHEFLDEEGNPTW